MDTMSLQKRFGVPRRTCIQKVFPVTVTRHLYWLIAQYHSTRKSQELDLAKPAVTYTCRRCPFHPSIAHRGHMEPAGQGPGWRVVLAILSSLECLTAGEDLAGELAGLCVHSRA